MIVMATGDVAAQDGVVFSEALFDGAVRIVAVVSSELCRASSSVH
jgi:hypothetical protein